MLTLWMLANAQGGAVRDADQFLFDQTFGELQEDLQNAREQGKHGLLVFFDLDAATAARQNPV